MHVSIAWLPACAVAVLLANGCQSVPTSDSRKGPLFCDVLPSGPGRYLKNTEANALEDDMIGFWLTILATGTQKCGWGLHDPNVPTTVDSKKGS